MTEDDLETLPSKVFDKALKDNGNDNGDGNKYTIACETITTDSSKQEKINGICTKLGKNLYYLENLYRHEPSFFDKHCYDLNYWLYNKVSEEFGTGETKKDVYLFFEKIQNQWNNIDRKGKSKDNDKKCMPESKFFKTGLFKSIKELLDYIENFDTFKKEMITQHTEPNKYCEDIKKCVPLYFTFKRLCQLIPNEICEKYLQNNNYDPEELLSKLACVQKGPYEVKLDENLVTEMIKTYQANFGDLFSGFGNILPGFGSLIPGLGGLFTGGIQGLFMNSIYDLMQKGLESSGITTLYNKITSYTDIFYSENFQKYGIPSLFALGCLIFLFIFYKCCGCLPCCFCKRRKKKRKRLSDLDTSGLMSAPLGFPAPMMPMNPYGLRYQPM